jgi:colanic acid/amylovoran biosynthesis glycosyltransferase
MLRVWSLLCLAHEKRQREYRAGPSRLVPDDLPVRLAVRSGIGRRRYHCRPMPREVPTDTISLLYVLYEYPKLSETFVRNEVHGLRALGNKVDVLSIERSNHEHIEADWAGEYRLIGQPGASRAILDHIWFALRAPYRYHRYLLAVASLRECWRVALKRLPTEARRLRSGEVPQVCHTHFAWDTASVAAYLSRLLGVPAAITVHANDIYVGDPRRLRARLRYFDRVVTVCNFNVGLLNGLGVSSVGDGGVDVVPCGVAIPDTSKPGPPIEREVISVGRLVEKKGFDTLIRAMALVRERLPHARATIIGEGPERAGLARLIADLGLEQIVVLAGARSHRETLDSIRSAKVFCLASKRDRDGDSDAIPVAIREAMACAVPVISTRVAGIPETVDEEVGWLVDPQSPAELADAITAALSDDEDRVRRGSAARSRVARRWTIHAQASGIRRVFNQLADPRRAPTPTGRSDSGSSCGSPVA